MSGSKRGAIADRVLGFATARGVRHWTAPMPPGEALEEVHIYAHPAGYLHYATSGLSRVGTVELTLRVPTGPSAESGPPSWPIDVLRRVASQFVEQRSVVSPNDTATYEPPILSGTAFRALAFVVDDQLGVAQLDEERVSFLTCVPLTAHEARACIRGSTADVVDRLIAIDHRLLATPRPELDGLDVLDACSPTPVSEGHGVAGLRWEASADGTYDVFIDPARQRAAASEHLLARLDAGVSFTFWGPERTVVFAPGETTTLDATRDGLRASLGPGVRAALADSLEGPGPVLAGPCRLHFVDALPRSPDGRRETSDLDLAAIAPQEARRRADAAFRAKQYDLVLQLIPRAIEDGSHGLLAQLLHIDTLRAAGRRDEALHVLWSIAEDWLSGKRPVWDTQWKRLHELARKLRASPDDPRLGRIAAKARR